jgi:hypothetical protein
MPAKVSNVPPNLRDVLRRLNPNKPAGSDSTAIPRVARDSNALRQLHAHIGADPYAKALLTGHIGVGKSTELFELANELRPERHVIICSIAQTLGVQNLDAFALLIVVLEACIQSWMANLGAMPAGLVEELANHVRNLLPEGKRPPKDSGPSMFREFQRMQEIFGQIPKKITSGEQLARLYSEVLQRLALRYVTPEQLATLDPSSIAMSCEVLLKELESHAGKPVLLLIDDLDKVGNIVAQSDIFLDRAMALQRLHCGIVATCPLDMLFAPRGRELDHVWGPAYILDPFPVPDPIGTSAADTKLKPYLTILRSIGAQNAFSALQCRKVAGASGGILRAFVYACGACVTYALEAGENHVRDYHIDLVARDQTDLWRGRLEDADYAALTAVLDTGGSNVPKAIHLLRAGVLIRDGAAQDERQFRPAPWVMPLLDTYRKRKQPQDPKAGGPAK